MKPTLGPVLLVALLLPLFGQQPGAPGQSPLGSPANGNPASQGQEQPAGGPLLVEDGADGWWEWRGRDGTSYRVRLTAVQSYGVQSYDIPEGGVHVVELTVDTIGSVSARFYFVEPLGSAVPGATGAAVERALGHANEIAERASGSSSEDLVIKSYPGTTHSHTIEYRLRSAQEIVDLADSLTRSLDDGRGRVIRGED